MIFGLDRAPNFVFLSTFHENLLKSNLPCDMMNVPILSHLYQQSPGNRHSQRYLASDSTIDRRARSDLGCRSPSAAMHFLSQRTWIKAQPSKLPHPKIKQRDRRNGLGGGWQKSDEPLGKSERRQYRLAAPQAKRANNRGTGRQILGFAPHLNNPSA
jgi:hypothetical protein